MTELKPSELQHAKWRVNFLKRLLNTHQGVRPIDIEAWKSQEADFLRRLQRAEAALDALENQELAELEWGGSHTSMHSV